MIQKRHLVVTRGAGGVPLAAPTSMRRPRCQGTTLRPRHREREAPSAATSRVATLGLVALIASAGCGAKIRSYERADGNTSISAQDVVCVMVGEDARTPNGPRGLSWAGSGETLYEGSGRVVSDYVLAVVKKTRPTAVRVEPRDPKSPFAETSAAGCSYLIVPTITRWEDRPQVAGRDQVGIALHLVRLDPWTVVRSVNFEQHSGNAVIRDQPASDILNDGFEAAVVRLVPTPTPVVRAVSLP